MISGIKTRILIVSTLCKTSYNVLINSHLCGGWGGERWFIEFPGGWVVKKRESPDLRSPEVGISVNILRTGEYLGEN